LWYIYLGNRESLLLLYVVRPSLHNKVRLIAKRRVDRKSSRPESLSTPYL